MPPSSDRPAKSEGLLISIEGVDGAGKSTVAKALISFLVERGLDVLPLREPGGSSLSEILRAVLKGQEPPAVPALIGERARWFLEQRKQLTANRQLADLLDALLSGRWPLVQPSAAGTELSAEDELYLFCAARAQLTDEVIAPGLQAGRCLIADRMIDSTVAYQGYGRGLDPDEIMTLCLKATDGIVPHLTLYLRVSSAKRHERMTSRGEADDRIEASGEEFFTRACAGFDALAAADPQRVKVLDADASVDQVTVQATEELHRLLSRR